MLSDGERDALAHIEQGLRDEDRRFADRFGPGPRVVRPRRWPIRATLGLGALLIVVGLLTSTDGLFLQGVMFVVIGIGWSRWRAARTERAAAADGIPPQSGARPDGTPPGGFRSV